MVYKARYHEKNSSLYQLPGGKISLYLITLGGHSSHHYANPTNPRVTYYALR